LKKEVGGIVAAVVVSIVVITVIVMIPPYTGMPSWYNPEESLPHLAAPGEVPGDQVNVTLIGNLSLGITGFFSTMTPHQFPSTFSFTIELSANNTGDSSIDDLHVVKVTIFYENATPVYTFGVVPDSNLTIPENSTMNRDYQNDRDMVSIPSSFMNAQYVFARVLVTYNADTEIIITTPLTGLMHAIE
jgi:hypothetical protein